MKYTPGPWEVVKTTFENGKSRIEVLRAGYSEPICHVHYTGTCNRWRYVLPVEDNAALIAAAPNLLEACKAAMAYTAANAERTLCAEVDVYDRCRAAIAKATGETE